jgi:hypothetical protein
MSLNALGVSQLDLPALTGAGAGATFSWGSGGYAGLEPSNYDIIVGTAGTAAVPFAAGVNTVNLSILNITSVAHAAACIVEVWMNLPLAPQPPIAAAIVQGSKMAGRVVYTAGAPDTCILNCYMLLATGAVDAAFIGTASFKIYVPRVGFF